MNLKISFLSFLFIIICTSLFSQRRAFPEDFKMFLDADLGAFYSNDTYHFQGVAGMGYRLTKEHSVGLEYRRNHKGDCCDIYSMQGGGAFYRFRKGLWAIKFSGGTVFEGTKTVEGLDDYDYKNSGHYLAAELKYHFSKAFRAGLFFTQTRQMNFDYYTPEQAGGSDILVLAGSEKINFHCFGITIGATLPPD